MAAGPPARPRPAARPRPGGSRPRAPPWRGRPGRRRGALARGCGRGAGRRCAGLPARARPAGPGAFCHGSTVGTALRDVQEALLREEPLFATREDEALATVAAGEGSVLVHRTLLRSRVKTVLSAPRRPEA